MTSVGIIGTGYVADLYMRSLALHPDLEVRGAHDIRPERLERFCAHWNVPPIPEIDALLTALEPGSLVLNLTNPHAHAEVSTACLMAGHHVYSEKPLAMEMRQAEELHTLARDRGLLIASAPCSILGEAAQTLWRALRDNVAGRPRLVYAEIDDGFIPQAPHRKWLSESGFPWPAEDEFRCGCTVEHAGYYLTWLIAMFGPIRTVAAASAEILADVKEVAGTPDFSVATLFFDDDIVARLTCSIAAPHDHRIRIIGDRGVLSLNECWDNAAAVRFHRRLVLRRRLVESPFPTRLRLKGPTHPRAGRRGAASMNFALGPAEMAASLREGRPCRLSSGLALHLNEATLAIQSAGRNSAPHEMRTSCGPMAPMDWAARS